ncbi:MAG: hypothetical protein AVDCRST_MAG49-3271 [uncultured Thermomicrobiales bacterium]|uniref:Xylose isomerase-like TIM barrel domain-containing protein n=1 Tax=uncultured Thermomicrobiales bacterium TaxID=1645740 RepID=A0A6J4V2W6_9BACT|nr:MAG: hypothetical protein AVDCRST_MAG49-3271 [uncultured Thermomicrobiales bacterium]
MATAPTPPLITLSTRASRLLPLASFLPVAAAAGLDGVDLDLTGRLGRPAPEPIRLRAAREGVPVRSVWLPPTSGGPLSERQGRRMAATAVSLVAGTGATTVVVDRPTAATERRPPGPRRPGTRSLLQVLRQELPEPIRIALVVRPRQLGGTRDHLVEMTALRRLAEEWDYDLALDLFGPIDIGWEAEAAVTRLLPRLTAIRLGPLESRPPGRGRARMTARVLSLAVDAGFGGTIATTPQPAALQGLWGPAIARAGSATAALIRDRYLTVHQPTQRDTFTRSRQRS